MIKTLAPLVAILLHIAVTSACNVEPAGSSHATAVVAFDPPPILVVGSKVGESLSKQVAVSGRDRLAIPDTREWSCGSPPQKSFMSNVAWLELANSSADTVSLSVEVDGLEATNPKLFVYERKNIPLSDCLTLATRRKLGGASSVILEPSSSVYMLLSSGGATGVYTVSARTDHILAP